MIIGKYWLAIKKLYVTFAYLKLFLTGKLF